VEMLWKLSHDGSQTLPDGQDPVHRLTSSSCPPCSCRPPAACPDLPSAWAGIVAPHGVLPGIRVADKTPGGVTCIRLDASVLTCHSDKRD